MSKLKYRVTYQYFGDAECTTVEFDCIRKYNEWVRRDKHIIVTDMKAVL